MAKSVRNVSLVDVASTIDSTALTRRPRRDRQGRAHGPLLVSELARDGRDGGQDGFELATLSETPRRPPDSPAPDGNACRRRQTSSRPARAPISTLCLTSPSDCLLDAPDVDNSSSKTGATSTPPGASASAPFSDAPPPFASPLAPAAMSAMIRPPFFSFIRPRFHLSLGPFVATYRARWMRSKSSFARFCAPSPPPPFSSRPPPSSCPSSTPAPSRRRCPRASAWRRPSATWCAQSCVLRLVHVLRDLPQPLPRELHDHVPDLRMHGDEPAHVVSAQGAQLALPHHPWWCTGGCRRGRRGR